MTVSRYTNPLEQLIVCPCTRTMHMCIEQDRLEVLDATWEDAHGRLPHEPGYGVAPIPEPIPDWVLADARDMLADGATLTRIARAILPATECDDLPSCTEILARRLAPR